MFIAIEGLDGTGKSTLVSALARHLATEPLRTPDAAFAPVRLVADQHLSTSPRAHTLFYATMVQYASDAARQKASRGEHVIVDRYWSSTVAYDLVFRRSGLPFDALAEGLFRPDITIFLEASLDVRRRRIRGRGVTSPEDARGLDPDRDARLCAAYDLALVGPHVGELVRLNVEGATPADVLRMAVNHIDSDFALRETLH